MHCAEAARKVTTTRRRCEVQWDIVGCNRHNCSSRWSFRERLPVLSVEQEKRGWVKTCYRLRYIAKYRNKKKWNVATSSYHPIIAYSLWLGLKGCIARRSKGGNHVPASIASGGISHTIDGTQLSLEMRELCICLGGEVRDFTRNTNSLVAAIGVLNARDIESDDLRSGLSIKLEILDASGNDRGFIKDNDVVGIYKNKRNEADDLKLCSHLQRTPHEESMTTRRCWDAAQKSGKSPTLDEELGKRHVANLKNEDIDVRARGESRLMFNNRFWQIFGRTCSSGVMVRFWVLRDCMNKQDLVSHEQQIEPYISRIPSRL